VTLTVRTGTALRWRPTLPACVTDLIRVHVDANGVVLALLANGFDGSFSTCWPIGSRLVLDLFVDAWTSSSGSTSSRLSASVRRSREQFATAAPHLLGDEHIEIGPPCATLLAVAVEGSRVHAAWIGGDEALLARGFEGVGRTTPHTLLEQFKRDHPEQAHNLDAIPNVVVRSFGPRADQDPPDVAVFDAQAGDTLLLVSKAGLSAPRLRPEDAAFAAAAYASPAVLAERLADVAFRSESTPFAAVVALRFDAVDFSAELDRLIAAYQPEPRHAAWLGAWARTERALPVSFDMGGVAGL
jgi:serine/threonine protein phosphatase PrpC